MTTSLKAADTREAILERAVDIASVEGLEGLTIGRLAAEMEMSKSGLFGRFGSKEDLQLATIEAAAQRFVTEVVEPARAVEPGRQRLAALCELYLDHLERGVYRGGCFWGATAAEFDDRPGAVRDEIQARVEAWVGALEREARAAGLADPRQIAFEIQALIQGANFARRLLGDDAAFSRARKGFERLLASPS